MTSDSDRQRLKTLSERISQAREAADSRHKEPSERSESDRGAIRAVRIGSDFVASVMVPTALGAYLDEQLGTGPWVMLGMVFVGFGLGFWVLVHALIGMRQKSPKGHIEE